MCQMWNPWRHTTNSTEWYFVLCWNLLRNKLHSHCANSSWIQQIEPSKFFFCLDYVQSNTKFMECRDLRYIFFFFLLPHSEQDNEKKAIASKIPYKFVSVCVRMFMNTSVKYCQNAWNQQAKNTNTFYGNMHCSYESNADPMLHVFLLIHFDSFRFLVDAELLFDLKIVI